MVQTATPDVPVQLVFEVTKKKSGSKPRPAICATCQRFHEECLNIYYDISYGRITKKSKKKGRVCPQCLSHPVKQSIGKDLVGVSVTAIDTYFATCPEKALRQGGPDQLRIKPPAEFLDIVGIVAHEGLRKSVAENCSLQAALGKHGLSGYTGTAVIVPKQAGFSHGVRIGSLEEEKRVYESAEAIIRYARQRGLVPPLSQRKKVDPSIIFGKTELSFSITFRQLLNWAEVPWRDWPANQQFNTVMRGKVDLLVVHKIVQETAEGKEVEYRIEIVDYKTYIPSSEELAGFQHSLQLRLYGLWAAWTFGVPLSDIHLEIIFVKGDKHQRIAIDFEEDDPKAALRKLWLFLSKYHKVFRARALPFLAEVMRKSFPPRRTSTNCEYCTYRGKHCSLDVRIMRCADCGSDMYWGGDRYYCPSCMLKE